MSTTVQVINNDPQNHNGLDILPTIPVAYARTEPGKLIASPMLLIAAVMQINITEKIQCSIKPPSGVL
jgi:hypothetical protein